MAPVQVEQATGERLEELKRQLAELGLGGVVVRGGTPETVEVGGRRLNFVTTHSIPSAASAGKPTRDTSPPFASDRLLTTVYFLRYPGPRSGRPALAGVRRPASTSSWPLTTTYSMPSGYWFGWSKVARSRTRAGSKTVMSA